MLCVCVCAYVCVCACAHVCVICVPIGCVHVCVYTLFDYLRHMFIMFCCSEAHFFVQCT